MIDSSAVWHMREPMVRSLEVGISCRPLIRQRYWRIEVPNKSQGQVVLIHKVDRPTISRMFKTFDSFSGRNFLSVSGFD